MGGGQMALIVGTVVLLAALVLNVNRSLLKSTDQTIEAEAILAGTSAAQQVIDLISDKEFDEAAIGTYIENVSDFTSPASLGSDAGETINNYDDVDDYNGSSLSVATPRMGNYTAWIDVHYVNPASPGTISGSRTRMKRIDVSVYSSYLPDTLEMFYYASY